MIKKLEDLNKLLEKIGKESQFLSDARWRIEIEEGNSYSSSESFEKYYFDIDCDINHEIDSLVGYYDRLQSISIVFG